MGARVLALARMARPHLYLGGTMAYALGTSVAYHDAGAIDVGAAVAGWGVVGLACLAAHYADEYADQDTDALTRRTWVSGGSGVLPAGLLPATWALRAGLACAALALALTAWAVATGVLPAAYLWIAPLGLVAGWFYSMGPVALERRGLGELDNALLGGVLMPLAAYAAQTGRTPAWLAAAMAPATLSVLANLLGVHWPDREADAAVGRVSLAVLAGEGARTVHRVTTACIYVLVVGLAGRVLPWEVAWATLATLPVGLWATLTFTRRRSALPDNALMALTLLGQAAGWVWAAMA